MTRRDLRRRHAAHDRRGESCGGERTQHEVLTSTTTFKPTTTSTTSRQPRGTQLAAAIAAVASLVAGTGCGGDGPSANPAADTGAAAAELAGLADREVADTSAADDPMLVAPSTTVAPTTSSTDASTTSAGTLAPTTVVTLPVPAAPPPPRGDEPYVELGRIEIPRLGIDTVLLQGITLTTLDQGPGHWPGTALPGQLGNAVIAGHRTSHDKVFRDIDQLEPGDEVVFTTDTGRFVYLVGETTIVKPDAMYIIDQTAEHTATLFACHPPGSVRERIVVHLDLAAGEQSADA